MTSIISVGSINADFMVRADDAPRGSGSVLGRDFLRTSGGKAANVAFLACRLGVPAILIGCIGDDELGEQALAGPAAGGVDLSRVQHHAGPTGFSTVVVAPDGTKTIVLATNANDRWTDAGAVGDAIASAPDGSVVVVDLEIDTDAARIALRASQDRGFVTVLDPAPADRVSDDLLAAAHVTPDDRETRQLTGIEPATAEKAAEAAMALKARGPEAVYVKLGDGGCVAAHGNEIVHVRAPGDVVPVDTTGAGDAFAAGLAWALLDGRQGAMAARLAVAASTCAVTLYGSQESYPSLAELHAMLGRVTAHPFT